MSARRTVLARYFGDVQGVGFRATVRAIAQSYPLRGWVKNESDGSVSLIATGDRFDVEAFLSDLRASRLGPLIDREEIEDAPEPGDAQGGFFVRG